jgi:uncharacterized protein (DUF1330 family)
MAAYVLAQINVTDPERYEGYKRLAQIAVERYGGRYVARGGETVVFEGDWRPSRVVILEFPDLERSRAFYDSPEYGAARARRSGAADVTMIAVAGV